MCFSGSVLKVVKAVLCFINDFSVGPEDWAPGLRACLNGPLQPGKRTFCGHVLPLELWTLFPISTRCGKVWALDKVPRQLLTFIL